MQINKITKQALDRKFLDGLTAVFVLANVPLEFLSQHEEIRNSLIETYPEFKRLLTLWLKTKHELSEGLKGRIISKKTKKINYLSSKYSKFYVFEFGKRHGAKPNCAAYAIKKNWLIMPTKQSPRMMDVRMDSIVNAIRALGHDPQALPAREKKNVVRYLVENEGVTKALVRHYWHYCSVAGKVRTV